MYIVVCATTKPDYPLYPPRDYILYQNSVLALLFYLGINELNLNQLYMYLLFI